MSSLIDLAALSSTVKVLGKDITVHGISAGGFAQLLHRFPALAKAMSGGGFKQDELIKAAPDAVAALIAAGCGDPGNKKAEEVAGKLPLEAQLDLIAATLKLTFPSGVGPFVKKVEALGLLAQVQNPPSTSSAESSTNSQPQDTPTPSK
jgi:hypothetical protein